MKVFYARVSTAEQNEARQLTIAKELNADKIFIDKMSGSTANRPQLNEMINFIREGDIVIVESISRLARSTTDLLNLVNLIQNKGAEFISQKEQINTDTPQGKFMLTIFGAMAQLEREQILQRQNEGIKEAKKKGLYKGRKPIQIIESDFKTECKKWRNGKQTATETMKKFNLKPNTFYRKVKERGL